MRHHAVAMYVDGLNLHRIARHLKVHHRTVSLWDKDHTEQLSPTPVPAQVHTVELDEMYTFIGDKKNEI
ncbi:MAG: helix-turn-helix domain-containing protein [Bacteroidetes bacterium]|nr:helix-turn-helix domain-containing protein [Bacteroidota bacterium]